MSKKLGLPLLGLCGASTAFAAWQSCDASFWKCLCDKDRCQTPMCREADRRPPECDCRYGFHETTWAPWGAYCQSDRCATTGCGTNSNCRNQACRTDGCRTDLGQPEPMAPQPIQWPGGATPPTGENESPIFPEGASPYSEQAPIRFPMPDEAGIPSENEAPVPSGPGPYLNLPQTIPPQFPSVPNPMPPMGAGVPQVNPYQPMPVPASPMPMPNVPNPAAPNGNFAPPTPSGIPTDAAWRWPSGPVQPTTHWQPAGARPQTMQPQWGPVPTQPSVDTGRWRVMPGYQAPQQAAVSQPLFMGRR